MFVLKESYELKGEEKELPSMFPVSNPLLEKHVRDYVNKEIMEYNGDNFGYFFCGLSPNDKFKRIMSIGQKIEHKYSDCKVLGAYNTLTIHGLLENGNEAQLIMREANMETMMRHFAQLKTLYYITDN